jgi:hypothetical protein
MKNFAPFALIAIMMIAISATTSVLAISAGIINPGLLVALALLTALPAFIAGYNLYLYKKYG